MMKKLGKYGLPLDVVYCSKCTRSNQRPHNVGEFNQTSQDKKYVILDKKIISVKLVNSMNIKKIDWKERDRELRELCNKYRKKMEILM